MGVGAVKYKCMGRSLGWLQVMCLYIRVCGKWACVYMDRRVYSGSHVFVHGQAHVFTWTDVCVAASVYVCTWACVYLDIHVCVHGQTCVCMNKHVCIWAGLCVHGKTGMYIARHVHSQADVCVQLTRWLPPSSSLEEEHTAETTLAWALST